jgi:hypothetical protein
VPAFHRPPPNSRAASNKEGRNRHEDDIIRYLHYQAMITCVGLTQAALKGIGTVSRKVSESSRRERELRCSVIVCYTTTKD